MSRCKNKCKSDKKPHLDSGVIDVYEYHRTWEKVWIDSNINLITVLDVLDCKDGVSEMQGQSVRAETGDASTVSGRSRPHGSNIRRFSLLNNR